MGFDLGWDDLLYLTPAAPFKALSDASGILSGADDARDSEKKMQGDIWDQRQINKNKQYDLLGGMQAPQMSPEMDRRLKALEDDSKPGPLVSDPYFQGQRAAVAQGGQQALSSVGNRRAAYDTSGGFSNQGSISDIYDRMGSQLAQVGAQSAQLKDQKSQVAAQARQAFTDSQVAYNNAIQQAKMAIESGDSQLAMQAISAAYQARENAANAQRQMTGQLLAIGGQIGAAAVGGGGGGGGASTATTYPQTAVSVSPAYTPTSPQQYADQASLPWAFSRSSGRGI
jgi:hypothetical protein